MTPNKQAGHTKGPWHISDACGGIVADSEGNWVASCEVSRVLDDAEQEANARLIAAAPELLEALKECVIDAEKAVNPESRMFGYSKAKAAIQKAGGAR